MKGGAEAPADTVLDSTEGADSGPAGIPEFWLGVLRANEVTASQAGPYTPATLHSYNTQVIQADTVVQCPCLTGHLVLQLTEKDEGILEYLVDISSEDLTAEDECGFKLTFEFAENPYFENKILVGLRICLDSMSPACSPNGICLLENEVSSNCFSFPNAADKNVPYGRLR